MSIGHCGKETYMLFHRKVVRNLVSPLAVEMKIAYKALQLTNFNIHQKKLTNFNN